MTVEVKGTCGVPFTAAAGGNGEFEGYICMYNVPTADWRRLMIAPGAFKSAVEAPDKVRMLWQHDSDDPIGVWTKFEERNAGLYGYGKIVTSAQCGADAYELVKAKAIDGISAGWRASKILRPIEDEARGFTTLEGLLMEASLVTFPAFEDARVQKASRDGGGPQLSPFEASYVEIAFGAHSALTRAMKSDNPVEALRTFERSLRDAGFCSKTEASRISSLVKTDPRWSQLLESRRDGEAEATSRAAADAALKDQIAQIIRNLKGA